MDTFELDFREVVGKGSFGTVYRAVLRRPSFRKEVAVKVLHDRWIRDRVIMARLRDEARVLGMVRHRALPSAEGLFWVGKHPALITEFVEGVTLTQLRAQATLPVTVALEICAEIASALHVAWNTAGPDGAPLHLVHRDIKPSNLQVTRAGEVKLLDFGIARAEFADREAETQNALVGSLSYMSPERLEFVHGPEGDVYSIGVVLAEVLLGRRPERTSADPSRHLKFLTTLQNALGSMHGPATDGVVALLQDLLAYEAAARPTAREVERRCRELRRIVPGPDLAEWADDAVKAASTTRPPIDEPTSVAFIGNTVTARPPSVVVEEAPPEVAAPLAFTGPTVARSQLPPPSPPRGGRGWVWGAASVLLVGSLAGVAAVGVALGFAGISPFGVAEAPPIPAPPEVVETAEVVAPELVVAAPQVEPVVMAPAAMAPTPVAPARPEPAAVAPSPRPSSSPPPTSGPASAGTAGSPVTAGAFASFVGSHPEWTHDEAISRKRASEAYLQGWTGKTPPDAGKAVTQVSFFAATAFCASRGGLPGVDASPTTWAEGSGPFQEFRVGAEGAPATRRFDGKVSTAVRRVDANGFTGFRCAR